MYLDWNLIMNLSHCHDDGHDDDHDDGHDPYEASKIETRLKIAKILYGEVLC